MRKFMVILSVLFCVSCGGTVEDSDRGDPEGGVESDDTGTIDADSECMLDVENHEMQVAANVSRSKADAKGYPHCSRNGVGLPDEYCEDDDEPTGLYNACWSDRDVQEFISAEPDREFDTPCMWLVYSWAEDEACQYLPVCVAEEQWPEFGWDYTWDEEIEEKC